MPGRRHRFSLSEDRQERRIERSARRRGYSAKRARKIGYGTVVNRRKRRGR